MKKPFPAILALGLVTLLACPAGALCSGLFHLSGADCCCSTVSEEATASTCCGSEPVQQPMEDCDCFFSDGAIPLSAVPFAGTPIVKSAPEKWLTVQLDTDVFVDPALLSGNYLRWLRHTQLGVGRSLYKMYSTYLC